jgi:hypothetical protein
MPAWFEDEEFWTATYPFMFTDDRLALGEEQAEKLLKLSGVSRSTATWTATRTAARRSGWSRWPAGRAEGEDRWRWPDGWR